MQNFDRLEKSGDVMVNFSLDLSKPGVRYASITSFDGKSLGRTHDVLAALCLFLNSLI